MPAQWTGEVVGEMHNNNITGKMLAAELGWHEKYLSHVLNSADPPKKAEQMVRAALDRLIFDATKELYINSPTKRTERWCTSANNPEGCACERRSDTRAGASDYRNCPEHLEKVGTGGDITQGNRARRPV